MRHRDGNVRYAEAYWSRSDRNRSSGAVVGDGAEGRALILPVLAYLIGYSLTQHVETKKHFDAIAEVVNSEEINGRPTEQQRQDQAQYLRASRFHEADGLRERAQGLRGRSTSSLSNVAELMFRPTCSGKRCRKRRLKTEAIAVPQWQRSSDIAAHREKGVV